MTHPLENFIKRGFGKRAVDEIMRRSRSVKPMELFEQGRRAGRREALRELYTLAVAECMDSMAAMIEDVIERDGGAP